MLLEHRKSQNEQVEDEQKLSDVFMKTLGYTGRYIFPIATTTNAHFKKSKRHII
jgi:hypothetical protein